MIERQTKAILSPNKKSPSKKSQIKDTMIPGNYFEILGSKDPGPSISQLPEEDVDDTQQLLLDKQTTLMKAMKAAADGNAEDASFLFRLHSRMSTSSAATVQTNTKPREIIKLPMTSTSHVDLTSIDDKAEDEFPFIENGITFMPGVKDL